MFDSGPCAWLVLLLLFPTPTILFSLDHKRRSGKRNRKKCSAQIYRAYYGAAMLIFLLYINRSQYGCRKIVLTLVILFSKTMIICAEQMAI